MEGIAGWREWIKLPDLSSEPIKTKLDTGARTSALHAPRQKRFIRNGEQWIRFELRPRQRSRVNSTEIELRVIGNRKITSSNGETETRPVVTTMCELGGQRWLIEITLTRRDSMSYRLLLGRTAMSGRFAVSSNRSFLHGNRGQ